MKSKTLFSLIIYASFMVTTIETAEYNEEPTAPTEEPTTTPFPSCLNPIVNPVKDNLLNILFLINYTSVPPSFKKCYPGTKGSSGSARSTIGFR
ncbi:unnamed protein product [Meloidogyne enterolobii]|uniref:Uncharacterized protein n=1 Tax=Meloidogyne enterolobii TaxID=390850 RepID=A0ACB0YWF1_MELEN